MVSIDKDSEGMAWWRASMQTRAQRLAWWRQARFGMFIHWGVYSGLGGVWQGQPVPGYAEHIQRRMRIPIPVYRQEVAGKFDPVRFDADEWVRLAKSAGMGYMIITAKHHDGFAMYDSAVSDYNIVRATPFGRDPMRELKAACDRHGLRFGFYYSQAWDWGDPEAPGNDWDYENPGGDRNLHGGREWWLASPELLPQVRRYVDRKAIPQLGELLRNYAPDILWFDTPHKLPPEENLRILQFVRQTKPDVVVSGRICQPTRWGRYGDYVSTTDKPDEFPPPERLPAPNDAWEAIPTTNESYGYHRMDRSHKPAGYFVRLLAKAAARGGNLLLNIGPMGDGRFDPVDVEILEGIGAWMRHHAESIRGTERTPLPVQAWGESTRREGTLYLHVFDWPRGGRLVVGGLRSPVRRAFALADPEQRELGTERLGELDVCVHVPAEAPDPTDSVVVIEMDGQVEADPVRLLSADRHVNRLHVFDGEIRGERLRYGTGKAQNAYVEGWTEPGESVAWRVRLDVPAEFAVSVCYDAVAASAGGTFRVQVGPGALEGTVEEGTNRTAVLGRVRLEPGTFEVEVRPLRIAQEELMRLRSVELTPAARNGGA